MIEQIVAVDADNGIANESGIPWYLPGDIEHFRQYIVGQNLLLGRETYEHIMRARAKAGREGAPGSRLFVVTSASADKLEPPLKPEWGEIVPNLPLFMGQNAVKNLVVCGGAGIYSATLPYADRLVITRLEKSYGCTKFYPKELDGFIRQEVTENPFGPEIPHTLEVWVRPESQPGGMQLAQHDLAA